MSDYSLTFDSDELSAVLKAVIELKEYYDQEDELINAFTTHDLWPEEQKEYEAIVRAEDKLRIARKV